MKKDLLKQAKEYTTKRTIDRSFSLLCDFMELIPDNDKTMDLITYEGDRDRLFINNEEICILGRISAIYQEETNREEQGININIIFEDLDINTGVIFATRRLTFKYDCTTSGEDTWKYELEDWVENPTYRDEVETEQAKQQYENEYVPFEDGDVPV